jgi:hypothetical protein
MRETWHIVLALLMITTGLLVLIFSGEDLAHSKPQDHALPPHFRQTPISFDEPGPAAPVSDAAVVSLATESDVSCLAVLLVGVRTAGKWDGAVVVIDGGLSGESRNMLRGVFNATVLSPRSDLLSHGTPVQEGRRQVQMQYLKMELFTHPYFRSFRRLVFLDAESVVRAPLQPLIDVNMPPWSPIVMRTNGASLVSQRTMYTVLDVAVLSPAHRDYFLTRYPDRPTAGASGYMVIDTTRLEAPEEVAAKAVELLDLYRPAFLFNEQSLLLVLYYDSLTVMSAAGPVDASVDAALQALPFSASTEREMMQVCRDGNEAWVPREMAYVFNLKTPCLLYGNTFMHDLQKTCKSVPLNAVLGAFATGSVTTDDCDALQRHQCEVCRFTAKDAPGAHPSNDTPYCTLAGWCSPACEALSFL